MDIQRKSHVSESDDDEEPLIQKRAKLTLITARPPGSGHFHPHAAPALPASPSPTPTSTTAFQSPSRLLGGPCAKNEPFESRASLALEHMPCLQVASFVGTGKATFAYIVALKECTSNEFGEIGVYKRFDDANQIMQRLRDGIISRMSKDLRKWTETPRVEIKGCDEEGCMMVSSSDSTAIISIKKRILQ